MSFWASLSAGPFVDSRSSPPDYNWHSTRDPDHRRAPPRCPGSGDPAYCARCVGLPASSSPENSSRQSVCAPVPADPPCNQSVICILAFMCGSGSRHFISGKRTTGQSLYLEQEVPVITLTDWVRKNRYRFLDPNLEIIKLFFPDPREAIAPHVDHLDWTRF